MRGLGSLTKVISQLLEMLGITLAPWMAPAVALALALVLLPLILRNMRTGKARKMMQHAAMYVGPKGTAMEREALRLVGDHAVGLVAICEEALRRGRMELAREAFERLLATGKQRKHARRIYRQLQESLPHTVDEMVILLEHLIEAGMLDEARRRLDRAHDKWPDSTELAAIEARLPVQG